MQYEISIHPDSVATVKEDFETFLVNLEREGIQSIEVMFGFPWVDRLCKGEWLYQSFSPSTLRNKLIEIEKQGLGEIGANDLYIQLSHIRCERLYCHECGVHLTSQERSPYFLTEKKRWIDLGWHVSEQEVES